MDRFLKKALQPSFKEWITTLRRVLHAHPEPSFEEYKTQEILAEALDELGVPYEKGLAKTGLLAELNPGGGPYVALRADMDGLPMEERTGLEFSSKNPGFMHACGHDGHMAMLLGAIRLLKEETLPSGGIKFIFQPGEEKGGGARVMIEEGVLEGVSMIFGGHIDRHFAPGQIACDQGLICAYTDPFSVELKGQGGHAARPHETVDCIVVASLMVMEIQTLVSREIDPTYPTVVTVGEIHGGHAHNCIAERTTLRGTVRSTNEEIRKTLLRGLERLVHATGQLYGAETEFTWHPGYPPVINDPAGAAIAKRAASLIVGEENVVHQRYPSLGGEDFAFYLEKIPGCFVRFGAKKKGLEGVPAHSPYFDFDESILPIGAAFLARVAVEALKEQRGMGENDSRV